MTKVSVPSHRGFSHNVSPPFELLEPLIEKTTNHWLWDGDFVQDDIVRFASFRWKPPTASPVVYIVARLAWCYVNEASLVHRKLLNTCGLTTCVNPGHFERAPLVSETATLDRVTLPPGLRLGDGTGARLVSLRGLPTGHVHILRDESGYTACYRAATRTNLITEPEGSLITCPRCLREWRDFDRPLLKVP